MTDSATVGTCLRHRSGGLAGLMLSTWSVLFPLPGLAATATASATARIVDAGEPRNAATFAPSQESRQVVGADIAMARFVLTAPAFTEASVKVSRAPGDEAAARPKTGPARPVVRVIVDFN